MTKHKRKRLSDLCFQERIALCTYIQKHMHDKEMLKEIHRIWGIQYAPNSMRYVRILGTCVEHYKKLENDNKLMLKWQKQAESQEKINYADILSLIAENKLQNLEFERFLQENKEKIVYG